MEYHIISDSSCDLTAEYIEKHNLTVIPFYVSFDGELYQKEGIEIGRNEFCRHIAEKKIFPKTSLPSIKDYTDYFEQYAANNTPVICITLNAKFSGSYQSALNAKEIVEETYPDAKIAVINSTLITASQGLLVKEAVRMLEDGVPYKVCINRLEALKHTGQVVFTIENMEYLKKGGRIGKLLTMAGTRLGIRPIITMENGEITSAGISRSASKAIKKLIEFTKEYFAYHKLPVNDFRFQVGAGLHQEEANKLIKELTAQMGISDITFTQIGATICSHTGPGIIGIAFIQRYDT